MSDTLDPQVKRVLDGEADIAALPPALRAEAEAAFRVLAAVDCTPVSFPGAFDARVMAAVRARAARHGLWRRAAAWLVAPREVRVVVRPWMAGALAAAAVLAVLVARPTPETTATRVATTGIDSVAVRFVLRAPAAHAVAVAGTFNQWDATATPLVPSEGGLWTATLVLPRGEHQYAFVVDGADWLPDPAAPAVDDGFGRRNSVLTVTPGRAL